LGHKASCEKNFDVKVVIREFGRQQPVQIVYSATRWE
jgi:hypothetical protein